MDGGLGNRDNTPIFGAPLPGPPAWGFAHAHQIPSDALLVIEVRDQVSIQVNYNQTSNRLDWLREGDTIVSDAKTIHCKYLARIEDPNQYTSAFVKVLAARLAMDMAIPLTQSRKVHEQMVKLYELELKKAAATDGQQGRSQMTRASRLVGVRGIGGAIGNVV